MKLKLIDRILLFVFVLAGTMALAMVIMGALYEGYYGPIPMIAAGLVLVLWGLRLLVVACKRGDKVDKGSVAVQNTEHGAVRVSVHAMETLVKEAIGHAEGVLDIKTHIVNHEDSITVKIEMTLEANAHIPNVTMLMQRNIKRFIEEFSGIAVREVVILVSEIRALPAPEEPSVPVQREVIVVPEQQSGETTEPVEEVPAEMEEAPQEDPLAEETLQEAAQLDAEPEEAQEPDDDTKE